MKVSYIITAVAVAAVVLAVILTRRPSVDKGTELTKPAMLKVHTLAHLPKLISPGGGDATSAFETLYSFFTEHADKLRECSNTNADPSAELGEACVSHIQRLYELGSISSSYLNKSTPVEINAKPNFEDAAVVVGHVAILRCAGDKPRLEKTCLAVMSLGLNFFEKCRRLNVRAQGMTLMEMALKDLGLRVASEGSELAKQVKTWQDGLDEYDAKYWTPKYSICRSVRPENFADVVALAQKDQDICWRVEATLALGRVKFAFKRGAGNDTLIRNAIEKLTTDPEGDVATAAKLAQAFTTEDVRKVK